MNEKLALLGGEKTIKEEFKIYRSIGKEEAQAVQKVLESGVLSKYIGAWGEDFYGGKTVKNFEKKWAEYFNVKHAIAVNSATSGLIAAIGALEVEPGDEVIVSPWTMSASAMSILVWNAIPVFADIDPNTFNMTAESIEKVITPYTKAIMLPDIFGQSTDLNAIMSLAKKHQLKVIEDTAQAPGAKYKNQYAGTIADIGVFSLNYHKHIHTGEGGVCVTNDDTLAEKLQLIRNHGESVVQSKGVQNITNILGFNFRMGEIEAAIGTEQLKKLSHLSQSKTKAARQITEGLKGLNGLQTPSVQAGATHVYYLYPLVLDTETLGVSRKKILDALSAEGVTTYTGYVNVHLLPVFQQKKLYGKNGFPWNSPHYKGDVNYQKGICPVAEKLHDETLFSIPLCLYEYDDKEVSLLVKAFHKVWNHLDELK